MEEVRSFLGEPGNLPRWTAHQTVYRADDGRWVERRLAGDVPLDVSVEESRVSFEWEFEDQPFQVHFDLEESNTGVRVSVPMPAGITSERATRTAQAIESELVLLSDALGANVETEKLDHARQAMGRFHLEIYSRIGA